MGFKTKRKGTRQSNIILGYEIDSWSTTTGSQLKETETSVRDHGPDHYREQVNPDTKSLNWSLGNDKVDYETTNFQPDPTRSNVERARLDREQETQLRQSHFVLGSDAIDYEWRRRTDLEGILKATREMGVSNSKSTVLESSRKNNIVWGYQSSEWKSQTQTHFIDHAHAGKNNKDELERTKRFVEELKKSSISFGDDRVEYSTTNTLPRPNNPKRTKPIRSQTGSSIVLGYDLVHYHRKV